MDELPGDPGDGERVREEHRVLSAVGQHPMRRRILACIGASGPKAMEELCAELGLSEWEARYHLSQLCGAELAEGRGGKYHLLPLGVGLLQEGGRRGT